MKTVARIIAVTAVMVVALSLGVAWAADPAPGDGGRELCFEFVDGTVITGRLDAKAIAIRIASGNVLELPAAAVEELTVGLNDRPGLVRRVESLIIALDSGKMREDAKRELIALGPAVALIVKRHAASGVSARRSLIALILKAYKTWSTDHPDAPEAMARPLELRSKVRTGMNTFVGTLAAREFKIASPYGRLTVKLNEIHRIGPVSRAIAGQFGRWIVDMNDKTRLKGKVISQSLRVQTRRGTMVVPFRDIRQATFAIDGKNVRVQCWGSDCIFGSLGSGTAISFKTDTDRVSLSVGKITVMSHRPRTFRGHLMEVTSVAFSPDGKYLVSASMDNTVKLWDTVTGKELITFRGESDYVSSVVFSPDGKRLAAAGGWDSIVKLWNAADGKELLRLKESVGGVNSMAFSPDGKRLAVGTSVTITIWDALDWTRARKPTGEDGPIAKPCRLTHHEQAGTMWRFPGRGKGVR